MNKVLLYGLLKYLLYLLVFYILNVASIQGLHPFAFGMLFALMWCNQKPYLLAPVYLLGGFLAFFDVTKLLIDLVCVGVMLVMYFFHYRFKRSFSKILIGLYAFLSQFLMLYYSFINLDIWGGIITLLIGLTAMYCYMHILESIILRGVRRKFLIDEIMCLCVLIFALGVGITCVPFGEYIYFGVLTLFTLLIAQVFKTTASIVFAIAFSLGSAFASSEVLLVAHATLLALGANATMCTKRVYTSIAVILVDVIVGLYFMPSYSLYHLLATMLGALIYLLIPTRMLTKIDSFVISENDGVAVRALVNRNRRVLYNRLLELSDAFYEMKNVFNGMVGKNLDFDEASDYLVQNIKRQMCLSCQNKNECLRIQADDTDRAMHEMVRFTYDRGKVSLLDVPANLCAHCCKLNALISAVNSAVDEYKTSLQTKNSLDSGRLLLGEQMWGVSQIMQTLANEVAVNVSFDTSLESSIIEGLLYEGVVCSEAIVYSRRENLYSITLVVRKNGMDKAKIIKVLSKVFGTPMAISTITDGEKAGFLVITIENANRYDIVFGSAGAKKAESKASGDTHSVLKLDGNKILLALSDGMGSGEEAEKTSSLALGLIENFYKAGFDNNLILSCVNKLLSLSGAESFSALDTAVVDLNNGLCDVIKLGSPATYIKSGDTVTQLDAGALPLGILEDIRPTIRSIPLKDGDMVILLTDGITDSFTDLIELETLIKETDTTNPQTLANAILDTAVKNYHDVPADDMTVLIGRIYIKV